MKMPIEWHRKCLSNQKETLIREEIELDRHIARVARARERVQVYEQQINAAAEKRKDGFDPNKFGKKVAARVIR
jgi:uncharacterized protein HemX